MSFNYKSPIEIWCTDFMNNIVTQVQENNEMQIMATVNQYVSVDKEELIKALNYDRQQYEKGYADAQKEWNTHKVACLLAELFGDPCACNYCGIDEWLPQKCDFAEKECPNVVGVACWEQFLKHRSEIQGDMVSSEEN